jgi:hypothetical protein
MICRLLLDEHIAPFLASLLRASGHDALSIHVADLLHADDEVIMEFAATQDRIILTNDLRDFPRLVREWNQTGRSFPGVVTFRREGPGYRPRNLITRIEQHITPDPARLQSSLTWLPPLQEQD